MNEYLFSTLGRVDSCAIVTAGRTAIVLFSSSIVLLAGLVLIYVRAARHPLVLLSATVFLAGFAALYPELVLVAAEASAVGLALVLVAIVLRRWTAAVHPSAPSEVASSATLVLHVSPTGEQPVTIAAAGSSKATIAPPEVAK